MKTEERRAKAANLQRRTRYRMAVRRERSAPRGARRAVQVVVSDGLARVTAMPFPQQRAEQNSSGPQQRQRCATEKTHIAHFS